MGLRFTLCTSCEFKHRCGIYAGSYGDIHRNMFFENSKLGRCRKNIVIFHVALLSLMLTASSTLMQARRSLY